MRKCKLLFGVALNSIFLNYGAVLVADIIELPGASIYGNVISGDSKSITIDIGCEGELLSFEWSEVSEVTFSDGCRAPRRWIGGGSVCETDVGSDPAVDFGPSVYEPGLFSFDFRLIQYDGSHSWSDAISIGRLISISDNMFVIQNVQTSQIETVPSSNFGISPLKSYQPGLIKYCPLEFDPTAHFRFRMESYLYGRNVSAPHVIVLGTFPHNERAEAIGLQGTLLQEGIMTGLVDTSDYVSLADGWLALLHGPMSAETAKAEIDWFVSIVSDAYIKSMPDAQAAFLSSHGN
jgi:hypothetical protein